MNSKAKVILDIWRIPLYFFIALIVLGIITFSIKSEDWSGGLGALLLFVVFPGLVITFVRALVLTIVRIFQYSRDGWPEVARKPEVEFFENIAYNISSEIDDIAEMSGKMRLRYLLFRIIGFILIAAGIVIALCSMYVIGTFAMIGGATLWIMSNPETYNARVSGVRMVDCSGDADIGALYDELKDQPTPYGTPYLAEVKGFKTDVLVYGPDKDYAMVIVYPKRSGFYYISNVCMASKIKEKINEPTIAACDAPRDDRDPDYVLEVVTELVESAAEKME